MHFGIHFGCQDLFQLCTWVVCMFLIVSPLFFPLDVLQPQHVGYGLIEFNGLGKVHCMAGALKGEHAQGAQYACTLHDLAAQADVERVSLVVSWLFGDSSVCV
jgi:hypothetical protein